MKFRIFSIIFLLFLYGFNLWAEGEATVKFLPGSSQQIRAVSIALNYVGTPYKSGGLDQEGFDCSGLVYASIKELVSYKIPRTSKELFNIGKNAEGALLPGDLVFFDTTGGPSHVGIFSGEGHFIHAASEGPKTGVIVSSLKEDYYKTRYLGARRVLPWAMPTFEIILDFKAEKINFPRRFQEGMPLGFQISLKEDQNSLVNLKMTLNGSVYMSKRMVLEKEPVGFLWFITQPGNWELVISKNSTKESLAINFFVDALEKDL